MAAITLFFSWQADTPTRVGRNFIERALEGAVNRLAQDSHIEAAARDISVDRDTKDVGGFPPIVETIFKKIDRSAIFVVDLTFVGKRLDGRPTPNPNVLIEYGWALNSLTHALIIPLMNTAFGEPTPETMPFDMAHLRRPITYTCAADASSEDRTRIRQQLIDALETAITTIIHSDDFAARLPKPPAFPEMPTVGSPAFYFSPTDVLARINEGSEDEIEYRFTESRAFYLRLIPTTLRDPPFRFTELLKVVGGRSVDVLSRTRNAGHPGRNRFGAISFEPHGTATIPPSLTQLFPNGELWGITTNLFLHARAGLVVPIHNVENLYSRVLENYCSVARDALGIAPPYLVEFGAVGLHDVRLDTGLGRVLETAPIYNEKLTLRQPIEDCSIRNRSRLINDFLASLCDLAGVER